MYGAGDVRVEHRPDPKIEQPTDAIVRVVLSCVCGSDLWPYASMPATGTGRPMGHEFLGVVEETGSDVATLRAGDVVVTPFTYCDNTCDFCLKGLHSSCRHGGRYGLDGDVYGQWRAMQELYGQGRIKAIGVSNFYPDRLIDLIDHNEVAPAVNQIETHPFFQRTADQQLMGERGVQIESWGPFAEGRNNLFTHPLLSEIADAHGKSVPQVVLRWLIQRGVVVIPKSVRPDRMAQNIDVFDFELTDDETARIATLDTGHSLFFDHRDPAMVGQLGQVRVSD
ncbi:hypothetical protein ETD85_21135 [Nonomuraea zeae]|uniref:Aldo/keto reductase n=2 Tax=Nonomuraea zeae TaxID=1642303 RepID=A0A5S4GJT0_9ACTN|nr:hypothetical protein ETD85_21135 [Nonomuraea zeae]